VFYRQTLSSIPCRKFVPLQNHEVAWFVAFDTIFSYLLETRSNKYRDEDELRIGGWHQSAVFNLGKDLEFHCCSPFEVQLDQKHKEKLFLAYFHDFSRFSLRQKSGIQQKRWF